MTYYECSECGTMASLMGETEQVRQCPVCDEATRWEAAFVDDDAGVSF
jgi:rubrerythrin